MSFIEKDGIKFSLVANYVDVCGFNDSITEYVMPEEVMHESKIYSIRKIRAVDTDKPYNKIKVLTINSSFYNLDGIFDFFKLCEYVNVNENNPYLKSIDGLVFSKDEKALMYVPPCYKGLDLTRYPKLKKIESYVFSDTCMECITLPDNINELAEYAFHLNYNLKEVKLSRGIVKLEKTVFNCCHSLESIVIPKTVEKITKNSFCDCPSLIVYCEHEQMPSDWNKYTFNKCEVVFGHKE